MEKQRLRFRKNFPFIIRPLCFLKKENGPSLIYRLFLVFSNKHHYNFYNKYIHVKNVHLVDGDRIQTYDLWNMNLLP